MVTLRESKEAREAVNIRNIIIPAARWPTDDARAAALQTTIGNKRYAEKNIQCLIFKVIRCVWAFFPLKPRMSFRRPPFLAIEGVGQAYAT